MLPWSARLVCAVVAVPLLGLTLLALMSIRGTLWPWIDSDHGCVVHVVNPAGRPLLLEYGFPESSREWGRFFPMGWGLERDDGQRVLRRSWVAVVSTFEFVHREGVVSGRYIPGRQVALRAWLDEEGWPGGEVRFEAVPDLHVEVLLVDDALQLGRVGRASWLGPVTWEPVAESGG